MAESRPCYAGEHGYAPGMSDHDLGEVARALARPDAERMRRQTAAYADYHSRGAGEWPEEWADDFGEIISCHFDNPEKSLAYVALAVSESDDAGFLGLMGCSNLENILHDPEPALLGRIIAEARKSARFRWLLNHPFKVAIAEKAWDAIEPFRFTGPHEEPPSETLPPR